MTAKGPRIVVGNDPYLLRSALHETFRRDERFETILLPEGASPMEYCIVRSADLFMVSEPLRIPGVTTVALLLEPVRIEIRTEGTARLYPYTGLDSMADLLVAERRFSSTVDLRAGPPGLRAPPGPDDTVVRTKGGAERVPLTHRFGRPNE